MGTSCLFPHSLSDFCSEIGYCQSHDDRVPQADFDQLVLLLGAERGRKQTCSSLLWQLEDDVLDFLVEVRIQKPVGLV